MSDRLTELQRQRALLQEHLAWLEREIARESGAVPAPPPAAAKPPAHLTTAPWAPTPVRQPVNEAAASRAAEDILAQYRRPPENAAAEAKRGCYLYFAFALGLLVIAVAAWYFIRTQLAEGH